ncbi:MAG: GvpL/GvpF family gas vesicle protein [Victivallales bacterium]|nr:GvpL/GvpF family gas vesicle protein [Victivallales bacterium]
MTDKEGKYIYCIIDSEVPESFGNIGIGGRGDEVYTISFKNSAAVISCSPVKNYRVSRENMMSHEKAIEEAMKKHTVLPVKFGTITETDEEMKNILCREYDKFNKLLKKMKDKKELGLKAIFKEDVIFKYIIEKHKDIAKLKEIISAKPPEKTHFQRAKIGEMVENALEQEKELYKEKILDALSPLVEDIVENKNYGDRMILNGAFLVKNSKEDEFDKIVHKLDKEYGDLVTFKYIGLIPPFNFVNLVIKI